MMLALKFLDEGGAGPYSGFHWPLPKDGKPGKWVKAEGDLIACVNGIHACTLEQALDWFRPECYVIELAGKVVDEDDKLVARKGRLIRRVGEWNEKSQRLFAADCAGHVLKFFEREHPDDKRPREAIRAARVYARRPTEANRAKMSAARDAAWDAWAARGAAWAARDGAAWYAARGAAWDARDAAARYAERTWQVKRLSHYIDVPELTILRQDPGE